MNNIPIITDEDDFEKKLEKVDLLINSKNFDEALKTCINLETNFSDNSKLNFKIAFIYKNLSQLELASKYYKKVLASRPDDPDTLNNLGNILNHNGEFEEAALLFLKVILLAPNAPQPYSNISHSYNLMGKYNEALKYGEKAIELNPNFIDAYIEISKAQTSLNLHNDALNTISRAIDFDNNNNNLLNIFYSLLKETKFSEYDKSLDDKIDKLFLKNKIKKIAPNLLKRIEMHPDINFIVSQLRNDDYSNDIPNIIIKLSNIPNFLKVISIDTIKNQTIEFILTTIRKNILQNIKQYENNQTLIDLHSAIAVQCFNNEYIFFETDEEKEEIKKLEKELAQSANNNEPLSSIKLLSIGSYINIGYLSWARSIIFDNNIKDVFKIIVSDVLLELALKMRIPKIKPIINITSKIVENQYSQNPYPRWNLKSDVEEININKLVSIEKIKCINNIDFLSSPPLILIAGCGTGQQSMETALQFPSSQILAIDLSTTSLAYALRKTKELHINNITFAHGDILDISTINQKFDMVECTGVLHHMDNPSKGLEELTKTLKQNGLMKIALYSKLARSEIIKFREYIERNNIKFSEDFVRKLRKNILENKSTEYSEIPISKNFVSSLNDFYSMSGIRDLLFHSKEYQFTIPDIHLLLDKYGLSFGGFVFQNRKTIDNFKKMFPTKDSEYSLANWNEFELTFGHAFLNMYQFWVQKK